MIRVSVRTDPFRFRRNIAAETVPALLSSDSNNFFIIIGYNAPKGGKAMGLKLFGFLFLVYALGWSVWVSW